VLSQAGHPWSATSATCGRSSSPNRSLLRRCDLSLQAACLANGIALNHPFLDGNKRSAWAACVAFLRLNGHALLDDALEPLAEQLIAQHELTDRAQGDVLLADWLRARLE